MPKKNTWITGGVLTAAFFAAGFTPVHKETTGHIIEVAGQSVSRTGGLNDDARIVLSTDRNSDWEDPGQHAYFSTGAADLGSFFNKDVSVYARSTPLQLAAEQVLGRPLNPPAWKAVKVRCNSC